MKVFSLFVPVMCLSLGCASGIRLDASKDVAFARSSNPEVVAIAAAYLQYSFASRRTSGESTIYYLYVKNADWKAVVAQAKIDDPKVLFRAPSDRFWSDEGFRDKETGLRALELILNVERVAHGIAEISVSFSAGTDLGSSAYTLRVAKKEGGWKVVEVIRSAVS